MNVSVQACPGCGHPMTISAGQYLLTCRYCQRRFHFPNPAHPAIALQPRVRVEEARRIMLRELRQPEIDPAFRAASFFEKATLYFIPFFEIRGVRAGKSARDQTPPAPDAAFLVRFASNFQPGPGSAAGRFDFAYNSFTYIERANDCRDLDIGFIDLALVEECLLSAAQIPYQPQTLRRLGVVLPATKPQPVSSGLEPFALPLVEHDVRVIHFPVWEIAYTLHGVLFKSYLEAVSGRVIRFQALRSRRRNIVRALLGLGAAAMAVARTGKVALVMPLFNMPFLLFFAGILGISLLLVPYFWQQFNCREMLIMGPGLMEAIPIDSVENRLTRFSQRAAESVLAVFRGKEEP